MSENTPIIGAPETKTIEESQKVLDSIFSTFENNAEDIGISAIMNALVLPEKEFALLAELILNEQEKALNNVEDKMMMVQALNANGAKAEDLISMLTEINERLDKEMVGLLSQQKIDFLKRFLGMIADAINSTEGIAKRVVPVAISYCREGAKQPKYAHAGDAGMDVFACEEYVIKPGQTVLIPTGIKAALPLGYELQVRPRSGQSLKTKLRIANTPGTIDANYRDEIGVIVENIEPNITNLVTEEVFDEAGKITGYKLVAIERGRDFVIEKGQRFAQLVLSEKPMCLFYEVSDVKEIGQDRASGFGGSGEF